MNDKAVMTRRIRSRARKWAKVGRISPERATELESQYALELGDKMAADRDELISEAVRNTRGGLWRCIRAARREIAVCPHMRAYWTDQVLVWLGNLRSEKIARMVHQSYSDFLPDS